MFMIYLLCMELWYKEGNVYSIRKMLEFKISKQREIPSNILFLKHLASFIFSLLLLTLLHMSPIPAP